MAYIAALAWGGCPKRAWCVLQPPTWRHWAKITVLASNCGRSRWIVFLRFFVPVGTLSTAALSSMRSVFPLTCCQYRGSKGGNVRWRRGCGGAFRALQSQAASENESTGVTMVVGFTCRWGACQSINTMAALAMYALWWC